jgi:hypothetical protein
MTAGRLAAAKPAATTNTTLYRCPIDKAASVVLNVCNQGSSEVSYRAALRDYDQILTLDSANYSFRKGNVVTAYTLEISPGIQSSVVNPSSEIEVSEGKANFKYHDIVKPTEIIEYDTKVVSIDDVAIDSLSQVGTLSAEDIVTGANTGLTATVYSVSGDSLTLEIDGIISTDTTFIFNNPTNLAANDLISIGQEICTITNVTGYTLTVQREQFSTIATDLPAGVVGNVIRDTANTTTLSQGQQLEVSDTVLTVADTSNIFVGSFISIGNEFMSVQGISSNTVTVIRGALSTTATTHADGSTVSIYSFIDVGVVNFFEFDEEISNGSGGSVNINVLFTGVSPYTPSNKYVYRLPTTLLFATQNVINVDVDRIVRFDLSDPSNASHPLKFSTNQDGTFGGGTEYTIGVTSSGTPGDLNSYVEINLSSENIGQIEQIFIYSETEPQVASGGFLNINLDPFYPNILIYDVDGLIEDLDSFTVDNVNYTVTDVEAGPYGYVQFSSGSTLKVSLGSGSALFATNDTFFDSPRVDGESRSLATINSLVAISEQDYILYDKSIAANSVEKNTGIVVGPGQSLMAYSSTDDISYSVNGFEDSTTDYTAIYYNR